MLPLCLCLLKAVPFPSLYLQHDEGYTTKRGRFMNRHQPAVRAGLATAAVGCTAAAAQLPAEFASSLLPIVAISMAYAAPFLPGGHSLRTLPGGKTIVACSMWALGCAWLPAVASGHGGELGSPQLAAMLLHTGLCSATVSGGECGGTWECANSQLAGVPGICRCMAAHALHTHPPLHSLKPPLPFPPSEPVQRHPRPG